MTRKQKWSPARERALIRAAVANYVSTEGCSCCESPHHVEDKARLAKLLQVRQYSDGSGYDFKRYESAALRKEGGR